jgi:hypothetical protein
VAVHLRDLRAHELSLLEVLQHDLHLVDECRKSGKLLDLLVGDH